MQVKFTLEDEEIELLAEHIQKTFVGLVKRAGTADIKKQLETYKYTDIPDKAILTFTHSNNISGSAIRMLVETLRKKKGK